MASIFSALWVTCSLFKFKVVSSVDILEMNNFFFHNSLLGFSSINKFSIEETFITSFWKYVGGGVAATMKVDSSLHLDLGFYLDIKCEA